MQKNIYANDKTVLKDAIPLEVPFCVSIEPTNICNFKCRMCFHGNIETDPKAKPLKNMDIVVFEKTLADLKDWVLKTQTKIKLIKLYSLGEPLLNKEICNMVKAIKEADVCNKIEITTNGSLLTEDVAKKLIDYGLDILRISVYSVYKDRFKFVTQSDIEYDLIYKNVKFAKEYRDSNNGMTKIYAKMLDTNSPENDEFIEKYKDVVDEVGIDEVFQIGIGDGVDVFENLFGEKADEAHNKSLNTNVINNETRRPCRYPFTHLTVRNDGSVIVCCSDWLKELCVGNIQNNTLEEIWKSRSLYELRCDMLKTKGFKWEVCRNCEIPFRDSVEDDVSGVEIEKLSYANDI